MKQEPQSDDNETDSEHHGTEFYFCDRSEAATARSTNDASLDNLLAKFFIENDIPFKAVKSSYLAKFVEKLRPGYKLPDPIAMKTSILEQIHEEAAVRAKPDDKIAFIKSIL